MPTGNGRKGKKTAKGITEASVKMFCQGLGDCFLITIPQKKGARSYNILIDFGVAMRTPQENTIMAEVAKKICALTNGVIDLLVVTHEHWDHVSGFLQAFEELRKEPFNFKHLWLAWTEDPEDKLALELRASYGKAKQALANARRMAARLAADAPSVARLEALDGLLAFYGPGAADTEGTSKGRIEDAIPAVRKLVGVKEDKSGLDYLLPGKVLPLPGKNLSGMTAGVRAYVLGPPHVRKRITKVNPKKVNPETYEKQKEPDTRLNLNWPWMAAALKTGAQEFDSPDGARDSTYPDPFQPFDRKLRIPFRDAESDSFFQKHYFADTIENRGRRIDGDWLCAGAETLALWIDSYTNNTSLVLAFELPESKKVLLFTGDAQVGNWLSWHDQKYKIEAGNETDAADLLSRTVLYKVGHHGSHNATLREQGLELMTRQDLVAMLPVEKEAVERLHYGEMPLQSLITELKTRTKGRILRIDEEWEGAAPGAWDRPLLKATADARKIRVGKDQDTLRPIYMEYLIKDV